ncbi:MAG: hypothetical protein IJY26_04010, partial [Clostridia bacterium]|nr:hypothetical protein [Clostridia bacterium]
LQAEFTRRSQKLKELEKEAEEWKRKNGTDEMGVEKLRKNARAHRAAAKEFDEFMSDVGKPVVENSEKVGGDTLEPTFAEESAEKALEEAAVSSEAVALEGVTKEEADVVEQDEGMDEKESISNDMKSVDVKEISSVARGEESLSSDELYKKVCLDEGVRLRVIGEYLSSLGKTNVPLTLGGVTAPLTPPRRARSIGAAGCMALQYFKERMGDAK